MKDLIYLEHQPEPAVGPGAEAFYGFWLPSGLLTQLLPITNSWLCAILHKYRSWRLKQIRIFM